MFNIILINLLSYIISFNFSIFTIIYLLKIPNYITKNNNLVKEYYFKNFIKNIPLDFILILIYLLISKLIIKIFNIKKYKLLTIVITTIILSYLAYIYYTKQPKNNNFFSRWFHTVGKRGIIYDIIIVSFVYINYKYLLKELKKEKLL